MAKIVLGKRPTTFASFPVKFTMPDGTQGVIKTTYKYRTRSEFGSMLNQMFSDAGEELPADGKPDFEVLYRKMGDKNADHLLSCIDAWDLEDQKVDRPTLLALAEEIPAAVVALMSAYSSACTEGRLGN